MECMRLSEHPYFGAQAAALAREEWGDERVVVNGAWRDLSRCEAFLCAQGDVLLGALHYAVSPEGCEILSLISVREHVGVGRELMRLAVEEARGLGAASLFVVTTNDNTRAIRFYQQFGMELAAVRLNRVDEVSRKMKPSIPLTGCDGIPIRHELEFSMKL